MNVQLLFNFLAVGPTLVAIIVCLTIGGRAERTGGLIVAANLAATWAVQVSIAQAPPWGFLLIDLLTAAALLWVTLSYPEKLWPGVAAVSVVLGAAFSATRLIDFPLSEFAYLAALNISSLIVSGSLITGSVLNRRRAPDLNPPG